LTVYKVNDMSQTTIVGRWMRGALAVVYSLFELRLKYNEDKNNNIIITYMSCTIIICYFVSQLCRFVALKNIRIIVIAQMTPLTIQTTYLHRVYNQSDIKEKK